MAELPGQDCDCNGFAFWPLHRIKTVPEECALNKINVPSVHAVANYFAFADYLQWSWAYAICLEETQKGQILQFGADVPRIIAPSFTDFVDAYLRDADQLYIPVQRRGEIDNKVGHSTIH
jgi:hypothetical protein